MSELRDADAEATDVVGVVGSSRPGYRLSVGVSARSDRASDPGSGKRRAKCVEVLTV